MRDYVCLLVLCTLSGSFLKINGDLGNEVGPTLNCAASIFLRSMPFFLSWWRQAKILFDLSLSVLLLRTGFLCSKQAVGCVCMRSCPLLYFYFCFWQGAHLRGKLQPQWLVACESVFFLSFDALILCPHAVLCRITFICVFYYLFF